MTPNVSFVSVNDRTSGTQSYRAYALYAETIKAFGATANGSAQGMEIAVINNAGTPSDVNPYSTSPLNILEGIRIMADSYLGHATEQYDASVAYTIAGSHKFMTGINIGAGNIVDRGGGDMRAISLGNAHKIVWYDTGGVVKTWIRSNVDDLEIGSALKTTAPTGASAYAWKFGDAVGGTVTPNVYLQVQIGATVYRIPAYLVP